MARVLPGMQSAFVEIGLERAAFLHVADIWDRRDRPIEKILSGGAPSRVKDPIGSKGARLSTQVSIAGRLLVYLPHDPHIGISQRIEDENGRAALRERLKELLPADEKGGSSCARWPRPPGKRSCAPTSPTCASCGRRSASACSAPSRRSSSTRICRSRSACCATW